ncbi:hypothetical protein EZV73_07420 [Acidaminobacter sp. JC074]|uniref:hypothetical protein n=1 Tax=Acidaminobacter sp. JC074 TaxID=2530199 RepID=UPI001F0D3763|nr:hypothetical protein [Acidaminobacter sp. JC074]MCH4887394.1 hypothetical protein [Acidaminobacter sp. JC074]
MSIEHKYEAREEFSIITDKPSRIIIDTSESSNENLVLAARRNYAMESLYDLKEKAVLMISSQLLGLF